jgi:hypothetical protein
VVILNPVAIWDLVSGKFGNPAAGNGLEMMHFQTPVQKRLKTSYFYAPGLFRGNLLE